METRVGWRMAGLAGEVVSHMAAGGLLGWVLDNWLGTTYWIMIGLVAGIATGLLAMIRGALRLNRQLEADTKRRQQPPEAPQQGSGGGT